MKVFGWTKTAPAGFRFLYADELEKNKALRSAAMKTIGKFDQVHVVNGWIEGFGYGGKVHTDCGDRDHGINQVLLISECYPI